MSDTEKTIDKYIAVPFGMYDESGTVYKVGPRGGKYYVATYQLLVTAQHVASILNTVSDMERA